MILVIDNYDSFTYNLVQYLGELGAEVRVFRNDQINVEEAAALHPTHVVISPGPGAPNDAGVSKDIIRVLGVRIPVLGVCLGQQCIGEVYGGSIVRAAQLMHGKTSLIQHNGKDLFSGIPTPFEAARYHSLIVTEPLPSDLRLTAWTEVGEVMGLRHKLYPIHGVQFHPESFLTSHGKKILANFIAMQPVPVSRPSESELLKPFIAKLLNRQDLSAAEAENAMEIIMTGQATPAQIGGYLVALRLKRETVEEITGSVRAMRAQASTVPFELNGHSLLDTAGTGGDGKHSFNISTAAAFVIAAAGRKVAKHGNRAASSQCGSADVLGALGVNLDLTPEQVAACIREVGIGFMFAPKFHPAMKYAIGPRKELGQRTIFNLLGPLTNPAGATHQLIGVYDPTLTRPLAEVLCELGSQAALVIHGHGGLDELTTSGPNQVSQLRDGKVETFELNAADYGVTPASSDHLYGGTPEENAKRMRSLLAGEEDPACVDVILFNAAAALATEINDFKQALIEARAALESGKALAKLNELISFSQKFALLAA
jgi:anthranilate synthase/phosphoribosyltransferase